MRKNRTKYLNAYAKENYKRIPLNLKKDTYNRFKTYCDKKGKPVITVIKEFIDNVL